MIIIHVLTIIKRIVFNNIETCFTAKKMLIYCFREISMIALCKFILNVDFSLCEYC